MNGKINEIHGDAVALEMEMIAIEGKLPRLLFYLVNFNINIIAIHVIYIGIENTTEIIMVRDCSICALGLYVHENFCFQLYNGHFSAALLSILEYSTKIHLS